MGEIVGTVDPGVRDVGAALFRDGRLYACDHLRAKKARDPDQLVNTARAVRNWFEKQPGPLGTLVVEGMETRRGRQDAHAALMRVSQVTGGIWATVPAARRVVQLPNWTGGFGKKGTMERVGTILDAAEARILTAALGRAPRTNHKEIYDAIGIGLYTLGRFK